MKKYALLLILPALLAADGSRAQQKVADVDKDDVSPMAGMFFVLGGEPFSMVKYVKVVDGSPYFNEDWMQGVIVLPNGTRYDSVMLKLDLLEDKVIYIDPSGNPLIASNRVRELWLNESLSGKVYHFIHSSFLEPGEGNPVGWYQELAGGEVPLYNKIQKLVSETRPYSSATMEQRIFTSNHYFIQSGNRFHPVKSLTAITDILQDKKAALQEFIRRQKLKGKSDADYISLIAYYTQLNP